MISRFGRDRRLRLIIVRWITSGPGSRRVQLAWDLFVLSGRAFSGRAFSGRVFSGQATRAVLCFMDWLAGHTLPAENMAAHGRTGRRGEEGGLVPSQEAGPHDGRGTSGFRAAGERLI